MQATCGNCGQPVEGSDITCPHCGVLLAAYVSPMGASPVSVEESPASADAIQPVCMDDSVVAPDETHAFSTTSRFQFDTNVTIEQRNDAPDGHTQETLLLVDEAEVVSKPVMCKRPDYVQPPVDAEAVSGIGDADPELVARPVDGNATTRHLPKPGKPKPAGEIVPQESRPADASTAERAEFWKDFPLNNYDEVKRGRNDDYLWGLDEEIILASLPTWMTKHLETSLPLPGESASERKDEPWFLWESEDGEPLGILGWVSSILFFLIIVLAANNTIGYEVIAAATLLNLFLPLINSLWRRRARK